MKPYIAVCAGVLVAACNYVYMTGDGANTISGTARLKATVDQGRTCAGQSVDLVADSVAMRERLNRVYGSTSRGFLPAGRDQQMALVVGTQEKVRRTRCDDHGVFTFDRVPDGVWYTLTSIDAPDLDADGRPDGGSMMARVEVRGGVTRKVVLP